MAVDLGTIVATLAAEVGPFEEGFRTAEARLGAFADMAEGVGSLLTTTVSLPLAAVGAIALEAANTFDEAMSTLERRTGASGDALASLGEQFEAVYAKSNQGAQDLAGGEATLTARTGATGEALGALLGKLDALADISGGKVAPLTTQAVDLFKRWGIASADQGHALDTVSRAAQMSGTSVEGLLDAVATGAPFLKAMNLDFVSSTSLLGSLGKAGVDTGQFVVGLRHALTQMAHEGITNANDAFRTLIDRIKDANTPLEAISIASAAFGPRVGVQLADAIRSGAFSLSQFKTELLTTVRPIEQITEHSKTLGERWTETWHQFQVAVTPVGIAISEVVKSTLIPAVQSVIEKLAGFGAAFNNLSPETKTRIVEIGAAFIALGPAIVLAQTAFGLLMTPITGLITTAGALLPALMALQPAFQAAAVAAGAIVVSLAVVAANFVGIGTVVQFFSDNWRKWWANIESVALLTIGNLIRHINEFLNKLGDLAGAAGLPNVAAGFKVLALAGTDAVDTILARVKEIGPAVGAQTTSLPQAFHEFMINAKDAATDAGKFLAEKIPEGAKAAYDALKASTEESKKDLGSLGDFAGKTGKAIADGIGAGAAQAAGAVKAAVGDSGLNAEYWAGVHGGSVENMKSFASESLAAGGAAEFTAGQTNPYIGLAGSVGGTGMATGGELYQSYNPPGTSGGQFYESYQAPSGGAPLYQSYEMNIPVTASGSPKIPLTDYFKSYAPNVVKDFATNVPGVDIKTKWDQSYVDDALRELNARVAAHHGGNIGPVLLEGMDHVITSAEAFRLLLARPHAVNMGVTASGSPTLPLSDYFQSYAPGVLKNFTAGIPGLDFTSNFSDLTSSMRTHLSAGIALGAQGLAADPAQLSNMIASLQNYVATWQGVDKTLKKFGEQDPFGLMGGIRPQDTAAGQAASAGRLLAMLQTLLQQIQGMNSASARQTNAAERTAAAVEHTAGGIQSLGSSFTSGRFIQGISTGVTRNQRSLYGNPTARIGV